AEMARSCSRCSRAIPKRSRAARRTSSSPTAGAVSSCEVSRLSTVSGHLAVRPGVLQACCRLGSCASGPHVLFEQVPAGRWARRQTGRTVPCRLKGLYRNGQGKSTPEPRPGTLFGRHRRPAGGRPCRRPSRTGVLEEEQRSHREPERKGCG